MAVSPVQTKREIEALLAQAGMRPRKRFGQHFLIDGNLMRRLVQAADVGPDDLVLEVGAGTGGLTDLLLARGARVVAVEIDRDLSALLAQRFQDVPGLTLLEGDVLAGKHHLRSEVADLIRTSAPHSARVKLVANLPYNVATPLVMNLLADYPQVRRLCFTVQAEVGERITSAPSCKAYGPLSIMSQLLAEVKTIARLPPHVFWPRPTVDSVMVGMEVRDDPPLAGSDVAPFTELVRAVFEHRRKTLRSALGYALAEPRRAWVLEQFDGSRRPESFAVGEWLRLYRVARECVSEARAPGSEGDESPAAPPDPGRAWDSSR
ncbi:MAG: ribosomal RNA small subunit methyltransferase A [Planctomycetes bacterium]|nr:ribosomal RNA small subunit methyltransferase A [Planctomycetota bacterium]